MNVFSESPQAVAAILAQHFAEATRIIDPTGSIGVFYRDLPEHVKATRGDIRPEVSPDYIGDFRSIPFADASFDVSFFDPPYKRGSRNKGTTTDRYAQRYGVAPNNENAATKLYYEGIPELFRVARSGVVIKMQDAADGHTFHDRRYLVTKRVEELTGLRPHDTVLIHRKEPMSTLTNGRRRFFRQAVSYFVVWKFRSKEPFRQFRH